MRAELREIGPVPYFWQTLDWDRLVADYPPPPLFAEATSALSEEALRALQERRLLDRVRGAWEIPFYRERWRAAGLERGDVASLDDLGNIPPFTSDDLRDAIAAAPPFGLHHPIGRQDFSRHVLQIHLDGGDDALPALFDPIAIEVQGIQLARALYAQGARPGHIVQVPITNAMRSEGWNAYVATFEWLGCVPVTTGYDAVTPAQRQIELAADFGTNGWIGDTGYLARLADVATTMRFDLTSLPTVFLQAPRLATADDARLRQRVEMAFGAPLYDIYGGHELGYVAFECTERSGLHVNDDSVLAETVGDELVVTTLYRSMPPFIRYRLSDRFAPQRRSPCGCGLVTRKLVRQAPSG